MAWLDRDRDGRHDVTGETYDEYLAHQASLGGPSEEGEQRDVYDSEAEYRAAQTAARDRGDIESTRDRAPGGRTGAGPGGRTSSSGSAAGGSDVDATLEGTWLLGDLGGSTARQAARRQADQQAQRQADIDDYADYLPTADDLWVQYEEEGNVAGPERSEAANVFADQGLIDTQGQALGAFEDIVNSGGLTSADRGKLALGEQEMGRAMRSQRDADMSQLRARGMGGSGASVQSMLSAQQGGADMLAGREAQMQIEGQRRRDAAIGAMGDMAGGMRDQGFNEGAYRGEAADSFNRYQTDYQRGREQRNTGYRNATRESRATSRQGAADNRRDEAALRTSQYGPTKDPNDVANESNDRTSGLIGGILSAL